MVDRFTAEKHLSGLDNRFSGYLPLVSAVDVPGPGTRGAGTNSGPTIGWYVHHHGRGHLLRCRSVARHLPGVTVLSSLPSERWAPWVQLPPDTGGPTEQATAGDVFHWAPRGHDGLRGRMAAIARWVEEHRPSAFVVDVSVEVATFVRLLGVPVVVVAMPGTRDDAVHQLAYRLADRIVAPWPGELDRPAWLEPHADKVVFTGGIPSFDADAATEPERRGGRRVLLLGGTGGTSLDAGLAPSLAAEGWDVAALGGPHGWRPDVRSELHRADVVVTHAGQGAVADVAAAGRPAVVVPEPRPYDEQRATAAVLDRADLALTRPSWDEVGPELVEEAWQRSGDATREWTRWRTRGAAERMAAAVLEVADA